MARRAKSKQKAADYPMPVTTARAAIPEVAHPEITQNGPTTGYRDAPDGKVERKGFENGVLPKGWHDTPAKCENCDGKSHPEYVED